MVQLFSWLFQAARVCFLLPPFAASWWASRSRSAGLTWAWEPEGVAQLCQAPLSGTGEAVLSNGTKGRGCQGGGIYFALISLALMSRSIHVSLPVSPLGPAGSPVASCPGPIPQENSPRNLLTCMGSSPRWAQASLDGKAIES